MGSYFMFLVSVCCVSLCASFFTGEGTPPEIKDIVIGRCEDFKKGYVNPLVDTETLKDRNCTELWELFYKTFAYREPCDVIMDDYDEFITAAGHDFRADSALFWDGWDIYDTITEYAFRGRRSTVLDTTLPGYMINYLFFCGSTTDPSGMNMTVCPGEGECGFGLGSIDAFWASASTYFAENARGISRIFMNSNRPGGAFHLDDSFFTEFELKTITKEAVSFFQITLITMLEEDPGDTCSSDSIMELKRILDEKEIPYDCDENPRDVLHMLCIDNFKHEDCVGLSTSTGQPITATVTLRALSLALAIWIALFRPVN
ncbi:ADP-ribosyl cyclase/cyclic ADP-ribose hydrolase-like [Ptychodera flava]|uniref:ADP-ribosyl cyclase/cyclic ADP-ribose hydrolase-like n=1 Tax=Ptychodera flava TaxID=63121 RepID=UPI00396A129A